LPPFSLPTWLAAAGAGRRGYIMEKIYWDDLEEGAVFWGDTVVVDPEEMLEYARRNDPQPFHLDEAAAKATPFGGLIASAGYTVTLWYRSAIPILTNLAFLGGFEWLIKLPKFEVCFTPNTGRN